MLLDLQMFIVKTLIIQNAHSHYFYTKWKEGETGKQRERQRKRVCESVSIAERRTLVSVIKLAIGKTH